MGQHIVVLGGGPAGYVAASHAVSLGSKVTLIDPKPLGGVCLNLGCIPTKSLVDSCSLLEKIRKAKDYGLNITGEVSVDWGDLRRRAAGVISRVGEGLDRLMNDRDVSVLQGRGRLLSNRQVAVDGYGTVTGDAILICTGSSALWPAQFDLDRKRIATSDDVLNWPSLPRSLLIVGGGLVSCEFAFIFRSLGVDVTILSRSDRPMPFLDWDISNIVLREMRKKGIKIQTRAAVDQLKVIENGVTAFEKGGALATAERALIAIGRSPNSHSLGLAEVAVELDEKGYIRTNEFLRTSVVGVYAVGDVNGRAGLAHASSAQARIAVEHALGREPAAYNQSAIPTAIFTMPEIGCVGLTEQEARAEGRALQCGSFDLRGLGRAHALGEISGMAKVISDKLTKRLLGMHFIGAHASEIVHEGAVLLGQGAGVEAIAHTVHAHPTLSEAVLEAAEDCLGQATHKPLAKKVLPNDAIPVS